MKIICILFNVGKDKSKLSKDSKIRLLAGAELAKGNDNALIFFVGGNGLKISGAEMMDNFWKKEFSVIKNRRFILSSSNSTLDNIKEVQVFLSERHISFSGIDIISSAYHVRRLQGIIENLSFGATVLSAENILILKNVMTKELGKYLNSRIYKKKILLEKILWLYLFIDPKQKIISFWRRFSYRE